MPKTQYPSRRQRLSAANVCALLVISAVLSAVGPRAGFAQTPPQTAESTSWVFYGLWLNGDHGAPAHWDKGSPNFKIVGSGDPFSPLLKPGMRIVCIHSMNVRAACLVVNAGTEGDYQWAPKIGKSIQEKEEAEIVKPGPLDSKLGKYWWVEIKGRP